MPILDDQGAEALPAVGFTGGLASWSMRGALTEWPREPKRLDHHRPRRADVRIIEAVAPTHHGHQPALDGPRPGRAVARTTQPRETRRLLQNTRLTAVTTMPVRNDAALADTAMVASSMSMAARPSA